MVDNSPQNKNIFNIKNQKNKNEIVGFKPNLQHICLTFFTIIFVISIMFFLKPENRIYEKVKMAGNGEFKSASSTMIDENNYLVIDGQCGNLQPEIYNWKENKFSKTKNKIPQEYIPYNHNALKLKNEKILIVANYSIITKNVNKNFVMIYDNDNQTFTPLENTDLSKLYSGNNSQLFLTNNGNILLFNKHKLLVSIYYFNSKNFSLIQSNNIDNFDLFDVTQINENEILLYGKNGINYLYNLKNNTYKISKDFEQINRKLQTLQESKYVLGWEKPIFMQNGDIVFFDTFMYGKKRKPNKVYSKKQNKLILINDFKYPREDYSTILLPNDTILIFGGTCGNRASAYPFNNTEIYKNRKD